jgi:hypothetical protein
VKHLSGASEGDKMHREYDPKIWSDWNNKMDAFSSMMEEYLCRTGVQPPTEEEWRSRGLSLRIPEWQDIEDYLGQLEE